MRFSRFAGGAVAVALSALVMGAPRASAESASPVTLAPAQAHTVALSRCGSAGLSTAEATCLGFDAREIRQNADQIFAVGFENNQELGEKHVLQLVVVFDLTQVQLDENSKVGQATLSYAEGSTTRRSPEGESEYGILPTCNTTLGVPVNPWTGNVTTLVATRPAKTAGVTPATTGDSGSWDVTPQIQEWVSAGQTQGTLVLGGDDQSPDIRGQALCLSYLFDLGLHVDIVPKS